MKNSITVTNDAEFKCPYRTTTVNQEHSLVLWYKKNIYLITFVYFSINGSIFGFGWNGHGRIGSGTVDVIHSKPVWQNQKNLQGKIVSKVSAGLEHGIAQTSDGLVYTWGNAQWGALGTGTCDTKSVLIPTMIALPLRSGKMVEIVQIAAARYASFLVSRDGEVFTFGRLENVRHSKYALKLSRNENVP